MSSDYVDPIQYPEAWQAIEIGGVEFAAPDHGLIVVSGFKRDYGWDIKKGKGVKGATLTLNEFPPAEGKFVFSFWEPSQFANWKSFREQFRYDPPKKPGGPVSVYYPSLDDLGIVSIVCKSITALEHQGKGLWTSTVEAIEYLPPPPSPAVVTASGSSYSTGDKPGKGDDPVATAQQKQIADLLKEAKKP